MLAPKADSAASLDMGFDLVHLDGFTIHGLPPGGQVFLIARRVGELGPLFSEQAIDARMQVRGDTVTVRRIWFTQLWFVLHYMFYTRRNRVATVVTEYVETTFTRADLVQTTREYINDLVRKLGKEALENDAVYACLCAESGAQVDKYAERFIDLMVDGALVDDLGRDRYRQPLLAAVEMKNNHLQAFAPWMHATGSTATAGPLDTGREVLVRVVDPTDL